MPTTSSSGVNGSTRPEGTKTKFFSSGQFQKSSDWQTFKVVSPATDETVTEPYEASARDVDTRIATAKAALPGSQVLSRTTAYCKMVIMQEVKLSR